MLLLTPLECSVDLRHAVGSHSILPLISVMNICYSVQVTPASQSSSIPCCLSGWDRGGEGSAAHRATRDTFGICALDSAWTPILEASFPLRHRDLSAILFLKAWQNPNIAAPALGHLFHRAFCGAFEGRGSHSLSKHRFGKHTVQWAITWKPVLEHWVDLRDFTQSVSLTLWSQDFREERGRKPEENFKRVKGRTIGLTPEKSRFHTDTQFVWNEALSDVSHFPTYRTHSGLWPQSNDTKERDFTQLLLKLCKIKEHPIFCP